MKKMFLLIAVISAFVLSANAQKFKPKADFLKGQTLFTVEFDFTGMTIDGDQEADFIKECLNGKDTEAEKEEWKKNWENAPSEWIQFFMHDANNTAGNLCSFKKEAESEYTFHVKVLDVDPGNFAGPFSNPAKIDATVTVTKTGNSEVLSSASFEDIFSAIGLTPVESHRIKVSFGRFGDEFAELIMKTIK